MSEEMETKKKTSWKFRILTIILNLIILYVLSELDIIAYIIFLTITLIMIIQGIIRFNSYLSNKTRPDPLLETKNYVMKIKKISETSSKKISKNQFKRTVNQSIMDLKNLLYSIDSYKEDEMDQSILQEFIRKFILKDSKNIDYTRKRTGIRDMLNISIKYLKINRKYIIISLAGLLLSTMILSQTYLLVESYRQNHFNNYMKDRDITAFDITLNAISDDLINDFEIYIAGQKSKWEHLENLNITNIMNFGELRMNIIMGRRYSLDSGRVWVDITSSNTYEWNRQIYNLLSNFPTFPEIDFDINKSLLVINPFLQRSDPDIGPANYVVEDFVINSSVNILLDKKEKIGSYVVENLPSFNNYSLPDGYFDDIWYVSQKDLDYNRNNDFIVNKNLFLGTMFLPNTVEMNLLENLTRNALYESGSNDILGMSIGARSIIDIEVPKISEVSVRDLIVSLSQTISVLRSDISEFLSAFNNEPHTSSLITSPMRNRVRSYDESSGSLQYIIPVALAPMILISLFLLFFSLNLIEKWKEKIFSVMIQRGTTNSHLRILLIVEVFTITIFAVVIGMFSSIPLTSYLLTSSGVFQFNNDPIPVIIPIYWLWKVPLITFLIAFNFYLSNIMNVDKIDILESFEPTESKQPIWRKLNLDVLLFVFGLFFWIVIPNVPLGQYSSSFYVVLGPIALMLVIFGFPLVFARYLIGFLSILLSGITRRIEIIKLSIINIKKRKYFTSMLTALIIISMMLSYVALIVPITFNHVSTEKAQYELGTDIYLSGFDMNNPYHAESLNISGISYSEIYTMGYTPFRNEISTGEITYSYVFMGINKSSFVSAAYWENSFSDNSIEDIVNSLNEDAISMQIDVKKGLGIEDDFTFKYKSEFIKHMSVDTSFDFFPRLVNVLPVKSFNSIEVKVVPILMTIDTLISISEITDRTYKKGLYINVDDDSRIDEISKSLQLNLSGDISVKITNYLELAEKYSEQGQNEFLITIMHIILIISFLINLLSITFYNFITITDRTQEIAIYRALGLIKKQISIILFTEITSLVIIGVIAGAISGLTVSYGLFIILNQINFFEYQVPISLFYNIREILIYTTGVSIFSILSALYPVFKLSRSQTGSILRAE